MPLIAQKMMLEEAHWCWRESVQADSSVLTKGLKVNFAIAPEPSMADNIMLVKDVVILKLVAKEAPNRAVVFADDVHF
jgi:hypothetical protein